MRKKLQKFSLAQLIIAAVVFVINYFFFHFVTDAGITTVWQPEPGKPFVANLIGVLATLFLFSSAVSFCASLILFDKES
jgi:hypothetical protein